MIALESSENHQWPWSLNGERAETIFAETFPGVFTHLNQYRENLIKRQDQGRFWWELRSCAYWAEFDKPKLMYPEITWRAEWCYDTRRTLCNNTAYILPTSDLWILAVANSPVCWWFSWRQALHGKDEALRFIKIFVKNLPIPNPTAYQRDLAHKYIMHLFEIQKAQEESQRSLLDWLRVEYKIDKPSKKLQMVIGLDSDAFVDEVRKLRGKKKPLSVAALRSLRDEHAHTIEPAGIQAAEALKLERQVSDLVNEAYGLTPDEVSMMWATAPPRMPIFKPEQNYRY